MTSEANFLGSSSFSGQQPLSVLSADPSEPIAGNSLFQVAGNSLFQGFPIELVLRIFQEFSSSRQVLNCSEVCRHWHAVSEYDSIWRKLLKTEFPGANPLYFSGSAKADYRSLCIFPKNALKGVCKQQVLDSTFGADTQMHWLVITQGGKFAVGIFGRTPDEVVNGQAKVGVFDIEHNEKFSISLYDQFQEEVTVWDIQELDDHRVVILVRDSLLKNHDVVLDLKNRDVVFSDVKRTFDVVCFCHTARDIANQRTIFNLKDGNMAIASSWDGSEDCFEIFNKEMKKRLAVFPHAHNDLVTNILQTEDGRILTFSKNREALQNFTMKVWDLKEKKLLESYAINNEKRPLQTTNEDVLLCLSDDGDTYTMIRLEERRKTSCIKDFRIQRWWLGGSGVSLSAQPVDTTDKCSQDSLKKGACLLKLINDLKEATQVQKSPTDYWSWNGESSEKISFRLDPSRKILVECLQSGHDNTISFTSVENKSAKYSFSIKECVLYDVTDFKFSRPDRCIALTRNPLISLDFSGLDKELPPPKLLEEIALHLPSDTAPKQNPALACLTVLGLSGEEDYSNFLEVRPEFLQRVGISSPADLARLGICPGSLTTIEEFLSSFKSLSYPGNFDQKRDYPIVSNFKEQCVSIYNLMEATSTNLENILKRSAFLDERVGTFRMEEIKKDYNGMLFQLEGLKRTLEAALTSPAELQEFLTSLEDTKTDFSGLLTLSETEKRCQMGLLKVYLKQVGLFQAWGALRSKDPKCSLSSLALLLDACYYMVP